MKEKGTHLTIFATPKRFEGHTGIIQRNAITSWAALRPKPQIILFDNEPGTREVCEELGLTHIPEVARTPAGAPLVSDLFGKAQFMARSEALSYVNSDIILLSDFCQAVNVVSLAREKFMMVGRNWRTRIDNTWDFADLNVEQKLRRYVLQNGKQAPPPGNSDFFVFSRGLWSDIPPMGIGRGFWDPWLVYEARRLGAAVVDASSAVMAIHQNHDQSTYRHGLRRWKQEINHNYDLVGRHAAGFCLYDATHIMDGPKIRRARSVRHLSRYIDTLPLLHPALGLPLRIPKATIEGARRLRQFVALTRDSNLRLVTLVKSKLPADGITAILGLAPDLENEPGLSRGLALATSLLLGGFPVVAYDPQVSVMGKARRVLGGPVEFADSAEDCIKQADVIVVASTRGEFQQVQNAMPHHLERRRVLINCCTAFQPEPVRPGIEYVAWARRR